MNRTDRCPGAAAAAWCPPRDAPATGRRIPARLRSALCAWAAACPLRARSGGDRRSIAVIRRHVLAASTGGRTGQKDGRTIFASRCSTVANTVAEPLDDACQASTSLEHRPRAPTRPDDPGRLAQNYGSEGRARHVPDRAVAQGQSRSLADKPAGLPTWVPAGGAGCRNFPDKDEVVRGAL